MSIVLLQSVNESVRVCVRQGVIISIVVERGLILKVKDIINKNVEKKRDRIEPWSTPLTTSAHSL